MPIPDEIADLLDKVSLRTTGSDIPVYSVMIGNYDVVSPVMMERGHRYFLFTDRDGFQPPAPWTPILVQGWTGHPTLLARSIKILAHKLFPQSDTCVYFDASFRIDGSLAAFVDKYCDGDFAAFLHPDRTTAASEIDACIRVGKESDAIYDRLPQGLASFLKQDDDKLFASGFLWRRLSSLAVRNAMEDWFHHVATLSMRDQISLPYVLRSHGMSISAIPLHIYFNRHIYPKPHRSASLVHKAKWNIQRFLHR